MNSYKENVEKLIYDLHQYRDFTNLDNMIIDVAKECANGLEEKEAREATAIATNKFEQAMDMAWKLLYLIPVIPLEDKPEKWIPVEDSPMLGKTLKISNSESVTIEILELHKDTIDGSPAAVYRINANSHLAMMLYGNTFIHYSTENGEDMKMSGSYAQPAFIQKFPWVPQYPLVTTIIHVKDPKNGENFEDYGFISDIRNMSREELSSDDLHNRRFSPAGTSVFPSKEEVSEETKDNTESDSEPDSER